MDFLGEKSDLKVISISYVKDKEISDVPYYYMYPYTKENDENDIIMFRIYENQKKLLNKILDCPVDKVIYQDNILSWRKKPIYNLYDIRKHSSGFILRNVENVLYYDRYRKPSIELNYIFALHHLRGIELRDEDKFIVDYTSPTFINHKVLSSINYILHEENNQQDILGLIDKLYYLLNIDYDESNRKISKFNIKKSIEHLVSIGLIKKINNYITSI